MKSQQNKPLVSILLPTHNRVDVLPFAIRSVLAQTVQDFELLVVGDGCTDDTAGVVQGFNDSRIYWFDLPKGPAFGYANRNTVLQKAQGEFIAYMSHDDLWLYDHLERLLPFFDSQNIEIAFSRPLWVIPSGKIVPEIYNLNHGPTLDVFLNKKNWIPSNCAIHRRTCFLKYGYWDDTLPIAGDWDLWKRIINGGKRENFVYLSESTCLHFKASWRDESYDNVLGFRFWRWLFDSDQMPVALEVGISDGMTEQRAIWEAMSSTPRIWAGKVRTAVVQVLDLFALQGRLFMETLLEIDEKLIDRSRKEKTSFEVMKSPFLKRRQQMQLNQNILKDIQVELVNTQNELEMIKSTFAWKIHEYVANAGFVHRIYVVVIAPLLRWGFKNKSR